MNAYRGPLSIAQRLQESPLPSLNRIVQDRADALAEIERLAAQVESARATMTKIWEVGDGWGKNDFGSPKGTTGEGHQTCRWLAREWLDGPQHSSTVFPPGGRPDPDCPPEGYSASEHTSPVGNDE